MSWWAVWVDKGGHCFEMLGGRGAGSGCVRKTAHTNKGCDGFDPNYPHVAGRANFYTQL